MAKGKQEFNGYSLARDWFDFALNNPDKVTGNHTALYMWLIELNNRLSWVEKFGLSVREGMDGMSCKSRTTYLKCFNNLIDWKFIKIVKKSRNQYECNTISLFNLCTSDCTTTGISTGTTTCTTTGTIPQTNKPLNLETIEVEDVEISAKQEDFNEALDNLFYPPKENGEPKEKNSAKKEKVLPSLETAIEKVSDTAYWRTVAEHNKIDDNERELLFKIFYEQKEDHYKILFPTWLDMAKNFYHWVPKYKGRDQLQSLLKPPKPGTNNSDNRGPAAAIKTFGDLQKPIP